jgi:hypothetical protein
MGFWKESKFIVFFTGVICLATVCYVFISYLQMRSMDGQLQVMEQTLKVAWGRFSDSS